MFTVSAIETIGFKTVSGKLCLTIISIASRVVHLRTHAVGTEVFQMLYFEKADRTPSSAHFSITIKVEELTSRPEVDPPSFRDRLKLFDTQYRVKVDSVTLANSSLVALLEAPRQLNLKLQINFHEDGILRVIIDESTSP